MIAVFKLTSFDDKGNMIRTIIDYKSPLKNLYYNMYKYYEDERYSCVFDEKCLTMYVYESNREHYSVKLSISNLMEED